MDNSNKFEVFLEVAGCFNDKLNSVPILYGSLGLSRLLTREVMADDIDMLVEESIFSCSLLTVRALMEELGFELNDPEENEFHRGTFKVGISHDGDMVEFSGVNPSKLAVVEGLAQYRVLSLEDYLKTYRASSLDGYRRNSRQKKDATKIDLIQASINGVR